jgi:anti-sigma regulatory factor (Ser/Thr protein kinase)
VAEDDILELEFRRDSRAPALARAAVAAQLSALGLGGGSVEQTVVLLVSEVVTNAVRHSAAPADAAIQLRSRAGPRTLRIAVTDAGGGFVPKPRDPERIGSGYGLYLLEKAADRWGVDSGEATTVWFEIDRDGARRG